jgi:hypothetical protein
MKRFADNIRKVWQLLEESKTFREVLDFYHRVYPHAQRGGVPRLLELYRRAERATEGTVGGSCIGSLVEMEIQILIEIVYCD